MSKPIRRRFAKYAAVAAGAIALLLLAAHFTWKFSGSGKPELVLDREGVKVYSIKSPGDSILKFRIVSRIKTTLDRAIAATLDASLENCKDWSFDSCQSAKVITPWNTSQHYYEALYTYEFPSPFSPREFLLRTQLKQDADAGAWMVQFEAVPDLVPRNDCCVRITQMNNVWRFTPVANGEVEVQLSEDIDIGIPYFLFNQGAAEGVFGTFQELPRLYAKEKYESATIDKMRTETPVFGR